MKTIRHFTFAVLAILAPESARAQITDIPILSGYESTQGSFLSKDGSTVVGSSYKQVVSVETGESFIWRRNGVIQGFGVGSRIIDISADGSVVLLHFPYTSASYFRWTSATGSVVLPKPTQAAYSGFYGQWSATALSGDGSTVVGQGSYSDSNGYTNRAFKWSGGNAPVEISVEGIPQGGEFGNGIRADLVNHDGSVIWGTFRSASIPYGPPDEDGIRETMNIYTGLIWRGNGPPQKISPPAGRSFSQGGGHYFNWISESGDTVAGSFYGFDHAYVWSLAHSPCRSSPRKRHRQLNLRTLRQPWYLTEETKMGRSPSEHSPAF